jgi:hypothetical protein
MLNTQLSHSLANFDRAYLALIWSIKDFELNYARYFVEHQLYFLTSGSIVIHSLDSTLHDPIVQEIDALVNALQRNKNQLYAAIHGNDLQAIELGFLYLDLKDDNKLSIAQLMRAGSSSRVLDLLQSLLSERQTVKFSQIQNLMATKKAESAAIKKKISELQTKLAIMNNKIPPEEAKSQAALLNRENMLADELTRLIAQNRSLQQDCFEIQQFFSMEFAKKVFEEFSQRDLDNSSRSVNWDIQSVIQSLNVMDARSGNSQINDPLEKLNLYSSSEETMQQMMHETQSSDKLFSQHQNEFHSQDKVERTKSELPVEKHFILH